MAAFSFDESLAHSWFSLIRFISSNRHFRLGEGEHPNVWLLVTLLVTKLRDTPLGYITAICPRTASDDRTSTISWSISSWDDLEWCGLKKRKSSQQVLNIIHILTHIFFVDHVIPYLVYNFNDFNNMFKLKGKNRCAQTFDWYGNWINFIYKRTQTHRLSDQKDTQTKVNDGSLCANQVG